MKKPLVRITRDEIAYVRLSKADKVRFVKLAYAADMNLSQWLRAAARAYADRVEK